jgi:signal transduction histidine kinase
MTCKIKDNSRISNLLDNAIKLEARTISVILEKNNDHEEQIIVKIKDTGIGIASEIIPLPPIN